MQRQPLAKAGGTITSDESIASNAANQTLSSPVDNRKVEDDDDDYNNEDDGDVDDSESQEDDTDYAAEEIQPEDPKREDGLEEQFG